MPEKVVPGPVSEDRCIREAVCIHTKKIFDSCKDKDCIEDLRVYATRGCQEVIVREVVQAPERVDVEENIDLAAETDGLILKVEPELGDSMVKAGDTVARGDILISGTVTMEPPLYSD